MNVTTHRALIVGIDKYPAFRELKGAEGDADDVEQWLVNELRVPVANIEKLVSSKYQFNTVYDAKPIGQQIHDWLDGLDAEAAQRLAKEPAVDFPLGERVYLIFACHGYNAVTAQQTVIMPRTRNQYWDVIPLLPLRTYLQTSAYFEEIVLLGDACRDQLDYAVDPIWPRKATTHPNASRVRVFEAYAAKAGGKTKEIDFGGGRIRGVLTQAFLRGVRGAAADATGNVWAPTLESVIRLAVLEKLGSGAATISAPQFPEQMLLCKALQSLPRIVVQPASVTVGQASLKSLYDNSEVAIDLQGGRQEFLVPPGVYSLSVPGSPDRTLTAAWEVTDVVI